MTSHRGSGFHGPEGARQAGMPGGDDHHIGRLRAGGRRSTVRPGPLEYLVADRTCARPNATTDTGRAGVGSVRSFYEFVRASIARPSSHLPAKARCESRRGNDEARPAAGRARDRGPPAIRALAEGQPPKAAIRHVSERTKRYC